MSRSQAMFFSTSAAEPSGDEYFNNVSLLLHCDGSNGSTTYVDRSLYNQAITSASYPTVSTSVYKYGTGSANFVSSSSQRLTTTGVAVNSMGTGAFTWEAWIYISASTGGYFDIIDSRQDTGSGELYGASLALNASLKPIVYTTSEIITAANALSIATWYHIAMTRDSSNNLKLFVDGTQVGSTVAGHTLDYSHNIFTIGARPVQSGAYFNGYIDDIRVTKGIARYTSNFTAPTSAFPNFGNPDENFANVSLLLHADGSSGSTTFVDNSINNFAITATNTTVSTSVVKYGTGSANFTSTSPSKLITPSSTNLAMGTGQLTWECWAYLKSITGTFQTFIDSRTSPFTNGYFVGVNGSGIPSVYTNTSVILGSTALNASQWYHVALTRDSSNNLKLFIDGTQVGSTVTSTIDLTASIIYLGTQPDGNSNPLNGYLDEVRITKGVARYTSNFTAPTAPFANEGGTLLSTQFLIVAGGGGGGRLGGGGAGGFRTSAGTSGQNSTAESSLKLTKGNSYTVTVGSGGTGSDTDNTIGNSGVYSSISGTGITTRTSAGGSGGGGGGNSCPDVLQGGSGGGGGVQLPVSSRTGGLGTANQGYAGGDGAYLAGGGGGGGAGAVGAIGSSGDGGNGGTGIASTITGSSVFYAGGGGGGGMNNGDTGGTGGSGGGGQGQNQYAGTKNSTGGTANTGGGGGASHGTAANSGGSGVVILSATRAASSTTGSPTVTTVNGNTVYQFTASGSITF